MAYNEKEIEARVNAMLEIFKEKKDKRTTNFIETYSQVFQSDFESFMKENRIKDVDEAKVRFYMHEKGDAHINKDGMLSEIDNSSHFEIRSMVVEQVLQFNNSPESYNSKLTRGYAEIFSEDFKEFKKEHHFKDDDIAKVAFFLHESGEARFENGTIVKGHSVSNYLDKINLVNDYAINGKYDYADARNLAKSIGKAAPSQENETVPLSKAEQKRLEKNVKDAIKSFKHKDKKNAEQNNLIEGYSKIFNTKFENFKNQQRIANDDEAKVRFFMHESGQARIESNGQLTSSSNSTYFQPRVQLVQSYINNQISLGAAREEAEKLEPQEQMTQQEPEPQTTNSNPSFDNSTPPQVPPRENEKIESPPPIRTPFEYKEDVEEIHYDYDEDIDEPSKKEKIITETLKRSSSRNGVDFQFEKTDKTDLIFTHIKLKQENVEDRYQMLGVTSRENTPLIEIRENGSRIVSIDDSKNGLQLSMTSSFVDSLKKDNPKIDFGALSLSEDGFYHCTISRAGITKNTQLEVADVHAENKNFSLIVSAIQSQLLDNKGNRAQTLSIIPRDVIVNQRFFSKEHEHDCILTHEQEPIYSTLMIESIQLERRNANEKSAENINKPLRVEIANETVLSSFPIILKGETEPQYASILERDGKRYFYVQTRNDSIRAPKFYEIRSLALQETGERQALCIGLKNSSGNVDLLLDVNFETNAQNIANLTTYLQHEYKQADVLAEKNKAPAPKQKAIGENQYNVHEISHEKVETLVSLDKAAQLEREIKVTEKEQDGDHHHHHHHYHHYYHHDGGGGEEDEDEEEEEEEEEKEKKDAPPLEKKIGNHKYEILAPNEKLFKGLLVLGAVALLVSMFVPFAYLAFFALTGTAFTYQVIQPLNQIKKFLNMIDMTKGERKEVKLQKTANKTAIKSNNKIASYTTRLNGYNNKRDAIKFKYASDEEKRNSELEKFDNKPSYVRAKKGLVKAQNKSVIDANKIYIKQLENALKENPTLTKEQAENYRAQINFARKQNKELEEKNKRANLQQIVQKQDLESLKKLQEESAKQKFEREKEEKKNEIKKEKNKQLERIKREKKAKVEKQNKERNNDSQNTQNKSNPSSQKSNDGRSK